MTGEQMKRIREQAGLSVNALADFLYYQNERGLREMEDGKRPISGPIQRCLEAMQEGLLEPMIEREFGGR